MAWGVGITLSGGFPPHRDDVVWERPSGPAPAPLPCPPQDAPSAAPAPLAGPALAAALPRAYAATGRAVGGLPYLTRRMVTAPGAQAGPGDDPPAEPTDPDLTGGR